MLNFSVNRSSAYMHQPKIYLTKKNLSILRLAEKNVNPTYVNVKIASFSFGVTTCWTFPSNNILVYFENFRFHSKPLLSKNENKHPKRMCFIQNCMCVRGLQQIQILF